MPEERPEYLKEEHLKYLDDLRESGVTNMFGARPYLQDAYPDLTKSQAGKILVHWMQTFADRQDQAEERAREEDAAFATRKRK